MGDFRIVIEGMGGHGCGRGTESPEGVVTRCGAPYCPDCRAAAFVADLKQSGLVHNARLEHWPVPGAAGSTRTENPGPVDDLLTGVRTGRFA